LFFFGFVFVYLAAGTIVLFLLWDAHFANSCGFLKLPNNAPTTTQTGKKNNYRCLPSSKGKEEDGRLALTENSFDKIPVI